MALNQLGPPDAPSSPLAQTFLKSLYVSLGTLDTFSDLDLLSQKNWRRPVSIDRLIGISMIAAGVSWLVLLYPARALVNLPSYLAASRSRRDESRIKSRPRTRVPFLMEIGRGVLA